MIQPNKLTLLNTDFHEPFEFQKFNQDYKDNLLKLKNLVLVKFNLDTMVVPRESEVRIN